LRLIVALIDGARRLTWKPDFAWSPARPRYPWIDHARPRHVRIPYRRGIRSICGAGAEIDGL